MYVSGHTHRNMFFDDGVKRIYADNQIGYRNESPHLKSFLMDGEYDYFVTMKMAYMKLHLRNIKIFLVERIYQ